ncbi:MAG: hypothetical protein SGJ10_10450 [Bacteroidota bacterium]|nr:hypothetical protein [Bacteroidota bacterium]
MYYRNFILIVILVIYTFLLAPINSLAQSKNEPIGQCFVKGNRKAIEKKMTKLILKVSKETRCPINSITYSIIKKYTVFYTNPCRHLPKVITFYACGQVFTYNHQGLSGAVGYWLLGSWKKQKN